MKAQGTAAASDLANEPATRPTRAIGEQLIANWLAINGVEYVHERPYAHDTPTATHSQYHPDFYYPGADLYHEHFALDQFGRAPKQFSNYEDEVAWKRKVHAERGTKLIETSMGHAAASRLRARMV